jgi:hypothetical protein
VLSCTADCQDGARGILQVEQMKIKFDTDFFAKPEVFMLSEFLGLGVDETVGKLMRLASWFAVHTQPQTGVSSELIPCLDLIVGLDGFVSAAIECELVGTQPEVIWLRFSV